MKENPKKKKERKEKICRNDRHILNQMYTKYIQALFFVMRRRKKNQIYEKNCTHIYVHTYRNYTALHCTAHI
jgi:hypothetical protein